MTTKAELAAILSDMMRDIAENDVPREETWARACRALGRSAPKPLMDVAGDREKIGPDIDMPKRVFRP